MYTLMHNPQYRLSIAWQNVGYNQPPHVDFYVGEDMKKAPKPNIVLVKPAGGTNAKVAKQ
jgi:rhamnogalacturonan endolyase